MFTLDVGPTLGVFKGLHQIPAGNLLVYHLSHFAISMSIAERIEKIERNFLYDGVNDENKYHLVEWSHVCLPENQGDIDAG